VKVLIADDEPMHTFLLEMFLKKWGYEVTSTDNGEEALQILLGESFPDLAILDWMMPKLEGVEVCRRVKNVFGKANIYILLLTAKAQVVDRQKAFGSGADDYMTKPYDPEELRCKLLKGCQIIKSKQRGTHQSSRSSVTARSATSIQEE